MSDITFELAKALSLPRHTYRATLVLEVGKLPTLTVEMHAIGDAGIAYTDIDAAGRIKSVKFMLRLVPFDHRPGMLDETLESAFWKFDAMHKGYNQWRHAPMSERDAFKAVVRGLLT